MSHADQLFIEALKQRQAFAPEVLEAAIHEYRQAQQNAGEAAPSSFAAYLVQLGQISEAQRAELEASVASASGGLDEMEPTIPRRRPAGSTGEFVEAEADVLQSGSGTDEEDPFGSDFETDATLPRRPSRSGVSESGGGDFATGEHDAEYEDDDDDDVPQVTLEDSPTEIARENDLGSVLEAPDSDLTIPRRGSATRHVDAGASATQPEQTSVPDAVPTDPELTVPRRSRSGSSSATSESIVEVAASDVVDPTIPRRGGASASGSGSASFGLVPDTAGGLGAEQDTVEELGEDDFGHSGIHPRRYEPSPVMLPTGSKSDSAAGDDDSRHHIGRYRIVGELGRGGMGAILVGLDRELGREVAVKVMHDASDHEQVVRFRREAQISGQLEHPNITPVYELAPGKSDTSFFTMQVVRGDSLTKKLTTLRKDVINGRGDKSFALQERLDVFKKICEALAYAHSRGVLHRDLKPDNVMVGQFGEVHVMDWGLARLFGESADEEEESGLGAGPEREQAVLDYAERVASGEEPSGSTSQIATRVAPTQRLEAAYQTIEGDVMGTPSHMAPEQARGEISTLDARTDIYSLGVILYEMLTLTRAFEGKDVRQMLERVKNGDFSAPREKVAQDKKLAEAGHRVPAELEAVVLKAMATKQERRYASCEEMRADIDAYLTGRALEAVDYSFIGLLAKFVQRNKAVVAGTAAAILLAVGVAVGLIVYTERQTAQQIAGLLDEAQEIADEAKRIFEGHAEWAEQPFAVALIEETRTGFQQAEQRINEAQELFSRIAGLDPSHPDMLAARDELAELRRQIHEQDARADGQRQAHEDEIERAAQRVEGTLNRRKQGRDDARDHIARAQETLERAQTEFQAQLQRLHEHPGRDERDRIRQNVFAIFEDARAELRIADANLPVIDEEDDYYGHARFATVHEEIERELERVREVESLIQEQRDAALADWTAAEGEIAGRQAAAVNFDEAQRLFAQGRDAAEADRRDAAFAALLDALNGYAQALAQYRGLTGTEAEFAASLTGMLETLLLLADLAMSNNEFQVARIWMEKVDEALELNDEVEDRLQVELGALGTEIETAQDRLVRLIATHDVYGSARAAGDEHWEAGRYSAAAGAYQRAIEAVAEIESFADDVAELRVRVHEANIRDRLQDAETAALGGRYLTARDAYQEALELAAGDEAQRADIARRLQQMIDAALTTLLDEAHRHLEDDNATRAREELETLLELDNMHEEAQDLMAELIAREDLPSGFIFVRGGNAVIGNDDTSYRNHPARTVEVAPFQIAATEVSVEEYAAFVEDGGYATRDYWSEAGWQWLEGLPEDQREPLNWRRQLEEPRLPVVGVSAYEAQAYAAWRSDTHEGSYRLPSEVEREVVARHSPRNLTGGSTFPWGEVWQGDRLYNELRPVGSNSSDRSGFGVLDLAGNATEWVLRVNGETNEVQPDAFGLRGGSALMEEPLRRRFAVTFRRGFGEAERRYPFAGIRLVREVELR